MSITPKNWDKFQHYPKDGKRRMVWVKLYRSLLDDFDFMRLPIASKALAPQLWLLASEYQDGRITLEMDAIAFRLRLTLDELNEALKPLIECGFFVLASKPLARRKRNACLEREGDKEKELEKKEPSQEGTLSVVQGGRS